MATRGLSSLNGTCVLGLETIFRGCLYLVLVMRAMPYLKVLPNNVSNSSLKSKKVIVVICFSCFKVQI